MLVVGGGRMHEVRQTQRALISKVNGLLRWQSSLVGELLNGQSR